MINIKQKLLILLLLGFITNIHAQLIKSVSPSIIEAKTGETFITTIKAENVSSFFGASFNYQYNSEYIKLSSVVIDSLLGSDVVFFPNIDAVNGVLSIGISRKSGQSNITGSGNIIKVIFEIIKLPEQDSTIKFHLSDVTANDSLGNSILLSTQDSFSLLKIKLNSSAKLLTTTPQNIFAKVGNDFNVYIKADSVENLFGISFNFHYNNKYLKIKSVASDTLLGNDLVFFPNDDPISGTLSLGISRKAGQSNITGSGNIAILTFEVYNLPKQDTTLEFTFSEVTANDSLGNALLFNYITSYTKLLLGNTNKNRIYPISPTIINAITNSEFEANVYLDDVSDIFGISFSLNYSNTLLELQSVVPDTLFGNDIVFFPNIDNENGVVSIGISKKAGQENFSGSGNLIKLNFTLINLPSNDSTIEFSLTEITANDKNGTKINLIDSVSTTIIDITSDNNEIPTTPYSYSLEQNYPNPFNPSTIISYSIPKRSNVNIKIYDLLGNLIQELVNEEQMAGFYEFEFNANNLTSGTYFCKIQAGNFSDIKKMLLLK